jgi:hypothetical protein
MEKYKQLQEEGRVEGGFYFIGDRKKFSSAVEKIWRFWKGTMSKKIEL